MGQEQVVYAMLVYGVIAALVGLLAAWASQLAGERIRNPRVRVFLTRIRSAEAAIASALLIWITIGFGLYYCCS